MTPHPFDEAFDRVPPLQLEAGFEASKNQRWEHRVVSRLLEHYGLQAHASGILDVARAGGGVRALTFGAFREFFPGFPLWLVCRKVPWVHKTEMADFFKKFGRSRPFKAFERAEADAPPAFRAGRLGLVFEWLHVMPTCIISNYYHGVPPGTTAVFYESPRTDPPQLFVVQSFQSFLDKLPWTP